MSPEHALIIKAFAAVSTDPDIGPVRMGRHTIVEVVPGELPDQRRATVVDSDGREMVMTRFSPATVAPPNFPQEVPFVATESVWVGVALGGAAAAWFNSADPANLAATVVTASVASGWDLESSANLRFPDVKSVSLIKSGQRRTVTIISGVVGLIDIPFGSV